MYKKNPSNQLYAIFSDPLQGVFNGRIFGSDSSVYPSSKLPPATGVITTMPWPYPRTRSPI